MMNNSEFEFFVPANNKINKISPNIVLGFRTAGDPSSGSGNPALSNACEVTEMMNGWRLRFTLIDPKLKQILPADSGTLAWDIHAKDNGGVGNELAAVIIPLPQASIEQIQNVLKLQPKSFTFDFCNTTAGKICTHCESCQGHETFEATPDAELWLLQEGMLGKNEVERDMADATAQLGNNKELLKSYIQQRSQGATHDEALANVRAMIAAAIQNPTKPPSEEATINNIAERKKVPVEGMTLMKKAKTYAKDNNVSFEAALLTVSKGE